MLEMVSKLNTAKLTLKKPVRYKSGQIPASAALLDILIIVIGPPTSVFKFAFPVKIDFNPLNVNDTNDAV